MRLVLSSNLHIKYLAISLLLFAWSCHLTPDFSKNTLSDLVKFQDIITEAAIINDLPPALIAAVIHAESNFKPRAKSAAGARGLMQINKITQIQLGLKNVHDPRENIITGARYLKMLLRKFDGNLRKALAAYNAGPSKVIKYDGIPPYNETQSYVKKVLSFYHLYTISLATDRPT